MRINEDPRSAQHDSVQPVYVDSEHKAYSRDASFFSSMLEESTSKKTPSNRPAAPQLLTEASGMLDMSMNGFARVVRSSKKGMDLDVFKTFPRALFNAQLTSQVMVKCLAKTTQAIDKTCNMQS